MTRHVLKADAQWFDRIADGSKTAEVRKHDRDFQIGDVVVLVRDEWDRMMRPQSARTCVEATISHILPASVFPEGLQVGYSVLSLVDVSDMWQVDEGVEIR